MAISAYGRVEIFVVLLIRGKWDLRKIIPKNLGLVFCHFQEANALVFSRDKQCVF